MHMLAYLGTHRTHGQTISGALARLILAYHSQLILTCMHPQSDSSPCSPTLLCLKVTLPTPWYLCNMVTQPYGPTCTTTGGSDWLSQGDSLHTKSVMEDPTAHG